MTSCARLWAKNMNRTGLSQFELILLSAIKGRFRAKLGGKGRTGRGGDESARLGVGFCPEMGQFCKLKGTWWH